MATEAPPRDNLIMPEPAEEQALVDLDEMVEAILSRGEQTARLVSVDGDEIEIPASAFHALQVVANEMAHGRTIMLIPQGRELTTQQAADLLHVSRPHLIKLLEEEKIPFHRVGTHRRIKIEDVLDYRNRRNVERREALERLTRLSEEAPGGYR